MERLTGSAYYVVFSLHILILILVVLFQYFFFFSDLFAFVLMITQFITISKRN